MKKLIFLFAALVALASTPTFAQSSNLVVPGKSIGKIKIGFSIAQVRKILGKPDKSLRLRSGLTDDLYKSKTPRYNPKAVGQFRDKLEILYRSGRVVQIEVTSPKFKTAIGLSTTTPLGTLKNALSPIRYYTYGYSDGYVRYYLDQVQSGIAFESYGAQDNWFMDSGSETLIVHSRGIPVIPDQGGEFMSSKAYVPSENSMD